jgi:hypothetical protein
MKLPTFRTFARGFSPSKAATGDRGTATLIPDTVLPVSSWDRAIRYSRLSPPVGRARWIRRAVTVT